MMIVGRPISPRRELKKNSPILTLKGDNKRLFYLISLNLAKFWLKYIFIFSKDDDPERK